MNSKAPVKVTASYIHCDVEWSYDVEESVFNNYLGANIQYWNVRRETYSYRGNFTI